MIARHPQSPRPRQGFALIEVLVSLTILSIALTATMRSFTMSLRAARNSRNMTTAAMLAQGLIDKWELVPPEIGRDEGFFVDKPEYSYEATYTREPINYQRYTPAANIGRMVPLRRVTLHIFYSPGLNPDRRRRVLTLETALTASEKFSPGARYYNEIGFDD